MIDVDQIVFVHNDGTPTGEVGPKLASHTTDTKLHLACSCYILRRSDHKFLVTQRALSKKVWPGVWTNSVCGHPAPGEAIEDAVRRRARFELGIDALEDIACILPDYIYCTPPYNGIIEHEYCPVFVAYTEQEPRPNRDEVEAYTWVDWTAYSNMLVYTPEVVSYWAKDQYLRIRNLEPFQSLSA